MISCLSLDSSHRAHFQRFLVVLQNPMPSTSGCIVLHRFERAAQLSSTHRIPRDCFQNSRPYIATHVMTIPQQILSLTKGAHWFAYFLRGFEFIKSWRTICIVHVWAGYLGTSGFSGSTPVSPLQQALFVQFGCCGQTYIPAFGKGGDEGSLTGVQSTYGVQMHWYAVQVHLHAYTHIAHEIRTDPIVSTVSSSRTVLRSHRLTAPYRQAGTPIYYHDGCYNKG